MSYYVNVYVNPETVVVIPEASKKQKDFFFNFHRAVMQNVPCEELRVLYDQGVELLEKTITCTSGKYKYYEHSDDENEYYPPKEYDGYYEVNVHLLDLGKYQQHCKDDYEDCINDTFDEVISIVETVLYDRDKDCSISEYFEWLDNKILDCAVSHIALKHIDTLFQG